MSSCGRPSVQRPSHHAILLDGAAMGGEQQHHGVIRHLLDEGVGTVGDGNAFLGGGGDVDVVDTDGPERNEPAFGQRLDHLHVEFHALGVDGVGVPGGGDEALLGGGAFDDLGIEALERLHLVGVTASSGGEGRAGGGDNAEFGHFVLQFYRRRGR